MLVVVLFLVVRDGRVAVAAWVRVVRVGWRVGWLARAERRNA